MFATPDLTSLSVHCLGRMMLNGCAMMVACLAMIFVSDIDAAPCPAGTVALDVATTADLQTLRDELACTGHGEFSIVWNTSLQIEQMIDVSDQKNVTITGSGFPILRGTLDHDNGAGASYANGSVTGMFSVSEESILRLDDLVLEGGNAQEGGAISVISSSALYVSGCTFANNSASKGGETESKKSENVPVDNCQFSIPFPLTSPYGIASWDRLASISRPRVCDTA